MTSHLDRPAALLVDVDDTLTRYDPTLRGPYEHELSLTDPPNLGVIRIVTLICGVGVAPVYLTGRYRRHAEVTATWLRNHLPGLPGPVLGETLLMRQEGDWSPDVAYKAAAYAARVRPRWDVLAVLEDRTHLARMWRSLGLTCLQVADDELGGSTVASRDPVS